MGALSPVALRVALHHADSLADHEAGGGLLRDRGRERGAGEGERVAAPWSPFLDGEIEAGKPVVLRHRSTLAVVMPRVVC